MEFPLVWGREGDCVTFRLQLLRASKHISLMHSGGKPYECDQCEYSSKTAQNLKTNKLTYSGEKLYACDQCKYSSTLALALKRHKLTLSGERQGTVTVKKNCLARPSKENMSVPSSYFGNFWCGLWQFGDVLE